MDQLNNDNSISSTSSSGFHSITSSGFQSVDGVGEESSIIDHLNRPALSNRNHNEDKEVVKRDNSPDPEPQPPMLAKSSTSPITSSEIEHKVPNEEELKSEKIEAVRRFVSKCIKDKKKQNEIYLKNENNALLLRIGAKLVRLGELRSLVGLPPLAYSEEWGAILKNLKVFEETAIKQN